ncbi:hypothetical protein PHAVU_009G009832 [Phaseolus vulgaris]
MLPPSLYFRLCGLACSNDLVVLGFFKIYGYLACCERNCTVQIKSLRQDLVCKLVFHEDNIHREHLLSDLDLRAEKCDVLQC